MQYKYIVGECVAWASDGVEGIVTRVTPHGDIVVTPIGSSIPITTRACFLMPTMPASIRSFLPL